MLSGKTNVVCLAGQILGYTSNAGCQSGSAASHFPAAPSHLRHQQASLGCARFSWRVSWRSDWQPASSVPFRPAESRRESCCAPTGWRVSAEVAAADGDHAAGEVGGFVRGQKQDGIGLFLWGGVTLHQG